VKPEERKIEVKDEEKKELPRSGVSGYAWLLALDTGTLLVGDGPLARRFLSVERRWRQGFLAEVCRKRGVAFWTRLLPIYPVSNRLSRLLVAAGRDMSADFGRNPR
jgi:hypothetical protein